LKRTEGRRHYSSVSSRKAEEKKVWNDFLPGVVSIGFSVCVFLYAWISDIRRIQRLDALKPSELEPLSNVDAGGLEPLSSSGEVLS
jgi:hypothetical protein